jgi:drug/metabolite transporter (DMT)-like permease
MKKMNSRTKGLALVLATAVISGASIFLNKFGLTGFEPIMFTSLKNLVVALFLSSLLFLLGAHKHLARLSRKQWTRLSLIGLVGGSVPFLMFFTGLQMIPAASAAFIHKTLFVWASILALFFLGEKLSRVQLAGTAVLLAGAFVFSGLSLPVIGLGEALVLAATVLWAVENVLSKKVLEEVPAVTVAWARMFFGSSVLMAFLAVNGQLGQAMLLTGTHWAWIGLTAVFLTGYVLTFYHGLALVKVSEATAVLVLGSVVTSLLSLAWGVSLPWTQLAGSAAIVLGVSLLAWHASVEKTLNGRVNPSASPCPRE